MSKSEKVYLGFDLGASSGRAMLGSFTNGKLRISEINRFSNTPVSLNGTLYWNVLSLWENMLDSMRLCAEQGYRTLSGIGVDTWGVDFGLLGADDKLLANPVCYRDDCTKGIEQIIISAIGKQKFYRLTGLASGRVGTLPQLVALKKTPSAERLRYSRTLLMMSDLFRFFLCGQKSIELTAAGSSQLLNVKSAKWCAKLFKTFGIPRRIIPEIVQPGTTVGRLHSELATRAGLNRVPIIAVAGHDTASAATAAAFVDIETAFISSGTWSVLGLIQGHPITTPKALKCGFVNEFGLDSILFVKNLMGLYLFENLRRFLLSQGHQITYSRMIEAASQAKPFSRFLDINSPLFFVSEDPISSVKQFLTSTGQKGIRSWAEVCRAILEGLTFSYQQGLDDLQRITQKKLKRVCIVGGGSKNKLLCQMAADAMGLEVIAGPAEATAVGNLSVQALATGQLRSTDDIRRLIQNSFKLKTYKPQSTDLWKKNLMRYKEITKTNRPGVA